MWGDNTTSEWVHKFIHTLDVVPMKWYLETKLRHGTTNWAYMVEGFLLTFSFEYDCEYIDAGLQVVRSKFFRTTTVITWTSLDWNMQLEHVLECLNMTAEEFEEYLRNIFIPESEGNMRFLFQILIFLTQRRE